MARRLGLALGVALGLILLALVAGYGLAQTTGGKRFISAQLERALAGPGRTVEVVGLEGRVPFDMRLARLALADDEGNWLEVEGLRLDLAPRALLRGRLAIEEASAELIRVLRPPSDAAEEADDEPFSLPELPDRVPPVVVERLAVERIELAPPVLGEPAAFTLAGQLAAGEDGRSAVLALSAERVDRATARAALDARLDLDAAALELALSAEETGGLLGAVTGRPEAGAFTLRLSGAGPLDGWVGDLDIQAEGLASADGRLAVALAEQPSVRLDATLRPAPALLPGDLAALLGERMSLALTIVQTAAQRLRVEDFRAETAAAELTARAEIDFEDERLSAETRLAVPDLALLGALIETPLAGTLSAHLVADGALLQPHGRLDLEVTAPEVAGVAAERIATALDFAVVEPRAPDPVAVQVSGTGRAERLRLPEAAPLPPQDLAWRLDLTAPREGSVVVRELALETPDIELEATGSLDPETLAAQAEVALGVGALEPLTAPFGEPLEGRLSLRADLRVTAGAERIDIELSGGTQDLAGLPPGASELLGPAPRLTAQAVLRPDEGVEISSLTLAGAAATLGGELALAVPDQDLTGKITLVLPRLGALAPAFGQELAGALEVEASPGGTLDAPTVTLALRGDDLLVAGRPIDDLTLRTSARDLLTTPAGHLEAALDVAGLEVGLATDYHLEDGTLRLAALRLSAPRTAVTGDLAIELERRVVDGELNGEVADLVAFEPLLPVRLRGAAEFELRLERSDQGQSVALALDASQLRSDFGRLRQLRLRATVADALGTPAIEADLDLDELRHDQVAVDQLMLGARGSLDALALTLGVRGETAEPFTLDGRARLALGDTVALRLEQLDGTFAERPLRLAEPVELALADGTTRLTGLDLRWADARLRASADLGPSAVAAEVRLDALPLAALERFGAPPLAGQADASLRLSGPAEDPRGSVDLTLTGVGVERLAFAELPRAEFRLQAQLAERRLSVDATGRGLTEQPVTLTAELPLVARFDQLEFQLPQDGPLSARLDAELALARLAAIAGLDDQTLTGVLSADLSARGTVGAPAVQGTFAVEGGGYANGFTGTVLGDVTLSARAAGDRMVIERFSATDGGGGALRGGGEVALDPAADFPLELRLELEQARLVRRDDIDATLSGGLELAGNLAAMKLAGKITVERAEARIPDNSGPEVAVIPVEEIGVDGRVRPAEPAGGEPLALALDLSVDLPGRVFLRGRGLESEWQGNLQVTGTADEPRLSGTLEVRRGYVDFLDRRFELRQGVISFDGAAPPDPTVNIEAVAEQADLTAIVRIEGPARQPTITLASEPPLPEDEVLSRLLFDREASQITPAQAAQLALAVNRLRGGGGLDVLGKLRDLLGVDTLDVSAGAAPGESAVRAGKYLNDDVYIELERGMAEQSGRARVEVEILPNVSIEADTGQDAQSGVGIKWRYDY